MKNTVSQEIRMIDGKEYLVTVTRKIGRAVYDTPYGPVEADEYVETDWGPKLGVSRTYGIYPRNQTPEQASAVERRRQEVFDRLVAELYARGEI